MNSGPHEVKRQGRYYFDTNEIQELKDGLAPKAVAIAGLEREISDLKNEVKKRDTKVQAWRIELADASKKIEDGFEFRPIDCLRFKSYKAKEWIFVNIETFEVVVREDFEKGDEQRGIAELVWPEDEDSTLQHFMADFVIKKTEGEYFDKYPLLTGKGKKSK